MVRFKYVFAILLLLFTLLHTTAHYSSKNAFFTFNRRTASVVLLPTSVILVPMEMEMELILLAA
jgi:hypothetical protein